MLVRVIRLKKWIMKYKPFISIDYPVKKERTKILATANLVEKIHWPQYPQFTHNSRNCGMCKSRLTSLE